MMKRPTLLSLTTLYSIIYPSESNGNRRRLITVEMNFSRATSSSIHANGIEQRAKGEKKLGRDQSKAAAAVYRYRGVEGARARRLSCGGIRRERENWRRRAARSPYPHTHSAPSSAKSISSRFGYALRPGDCIRGRCCGRFSAS